MSIFIHRWLQRSAKLYADTIAIDDGQQQWCYRDLAQHTAALATGLQHLGISPQQRICLFAKNRCEYAALYFACAQIGAVLVPMNAHLQAEEIAWILRDCETALIIADPEFTERLTAACEINHHAPPCFVFAEAGNGWNAFTQLYARQDDAAAVANDDINTVVVQMYTSGTTGTPKGVMLSHKNISSVTLAWLHDMPLLPSQHRFLQVTPLFHVGGMLVLMSCISAGATLVLLPAFDPSVTLTALTQRRITHTLLVPAMINWLLQIPHIEQQTFPDLQLIVYGASPMPQALMQRALRVFGCDFLQGYGLTETAGVALSLRPEDHRYPADSAPPKHLAAGGRELLCTEVRIVDADRQPLPCGEIGEIVVRGANVTVGYWNNPAATAATLVNGWLHTGDLGYADAQGYIYIVDRLKDMIDVGGENVYPAEVENVLSAHPAIAEVAVIGIPNPILGEEVVACVVCKADVAPPKSSDIKNFAAEKLAPFKCPTRVRFVPKLPRTPAGKVQKHVLRDNYLLAKGNRE